MRKSKQKIGIIMIILLLLSYLTPFINVANAYSVSNAYIYSVKDPEYHLQYWNSDRNVWSYLITSYVGYTGEDGNFYPAYCLNSDRHGVGDEAPYTVTVTEAIQNQEVWRVLCNGFPYKTPEELGVANDYDAFCATKQAIYSVIYGYDPVARYRGGDERGTQIANAIVKMVNIARTTSDNYTSPQVLINEVGNLKKEGEYYTQTYSVSSNVPLKDYNVYQISGLPSGSYFADINGTQKTNFSSSENFKVYIPQKSIKSNVTSYIGVNGNCKTYPVLYGKAPNSSLQDYALILSPFENGSASKKLNISPTGEVTIEKTSTANNIWNGVISGSLISNAKYNLYNSNKNLVGTYTTNKEGKIYISNLPLGTYYVQETTPAPQYTTLNDKMYSFTLDYMDDSEALKVTNTPVLGGYFSAIKTSNENNVWTGVKKGQFVAGAKYGIYDLDGNIVKSYETGKELISMSNENGVIFDNEKLQLGEYYLQEIEAPEHYELDSTKYYFKITENEQKIYLELDNTPEIGNNVKITKVASDKNYITGTEKGQAVEGAKYEVRTGFPSETEVTADNFFTGELVDTLITDEDGKTKTIIVGEGTYYIKEVSVPKGWKLDEKIYKIDVITNGVTHNLDLEDEPAEVKVNVEKSGVVEAQPNDEIRYDFDAVESLSNVPLDNFTFIDDLPYEKVKLTKLFTGIYTDKVKFNVFYKTNLFNNWILIKENLLSTINNFIDFSNVKLAENEVVTSFKIGFGTVPEYFKATSTPFIFTKVNADVEASDVWTNYVHLSGTYFDTDVRDDSEWTTKTLEEEPIIPKLPKTGE